MPLISGLWVTESKDMHSNPQDLPPIAFTGVPQGNNSLHLLTEHAKALSGLKLGKALNRKPMLAEVEFPVTGGYGN